MSSQRYVDLGLLFVAAGMVACGSSDDVSNVTDGGSSGAAPIGWESGASGGGGEARVGGDGGDAQASGSAAGDGGGTRADGASADGASALQPLVPLVTGHVTKFSITPIVASQPITEDCTSMTATIGAQTTIDGLVGWLYVSPCDNRRFLLSGSGDQVMVYPIDQGHLGAAYEYVHSPIVEGESWEAGGSTQSWHQIPSPLVTPAGTFVDCWMREPVGISLTYCRGVGLVQIIDPERNYRLDILEKNF